LEGVLEGGNERSPPRKNACWIRKGKKKLSGIYYGPKRARNGDPMANRKGA